MDLSDNKSFWILALGHYPARSVEVQFRLRSVDAAQQLLELNILMGAIAEQIEILSGQLRREVMMREAAGERKN